MESFGRLFVLDWYWNSRGAERWGGQQGMFLARTVSHAIAVGLQRMVETPEPGNYRGIEARTSSRLRFFDLKFEIEL